jgi:hypothetical protein
MRVRSAGHSSAASSRSRRSTCVMEPSKANCCAATPACWKNSRNQIPRTAFTRLCHILAGSAGAGTGRDPVPRVPSQHVSALQRSGAQRHRVCRRCGNAASPRTGEKEGMEAVPPLPQHGREVQWVHAHDMSLRRGFLLQMWSRGLWRRMRVERCLACTYVDFSIAMTMIMQTVMIRLEMHC